MANPLPIESQVASLALWKRYDVEGFEVKVQLQVFSGATVLVTVARLSSKRLLKASFAT
ncbi:hypothetical protein [Slackia heliotrinireducens]|uniref:hypothetical protein n=1 Tax=Slackia heliotrinireducens TaxID=84110 RepID=UPI0033150A1A